MSVVMVGPVSVERMAVANKPWVGYATQERRMSVVLALRMERMMDVSKEPPQAATAPRPRYQP